MRKQDTVIITGADIAPAALAMLNDYEVVFAGTRPTEDDLVALCQQYNPVGIVVRYGKINARIMDAAPALRVISKHGSGIDVIDQAAAAERNISVQSAPGANAAAVAEHTWAMILACTKSLIPLNRRMRDGHWDKSSHKSLELEGRTLGLVGLGAIGGRVADIGRVFGMQVIAYDPWAKTLPAGCEQVDDLATLYARADIVSLHCPLTAQNSQMINDQALAQFKPGAVLVNTARGGLIDDDALVRALRSGRLSWAALDSFTVEPLTAPNLWQTVENVIITPHIGGVSDNSYVKMGTASVTNLLKILAQKEATV